MTRPRIDIAMTVRDGEPFLARQLETIVRQTRQPDRLVIVDDASTDGSQETVERFAAQAPFEVVVAPPHRVALGSVAAFERALTMCDGDLIAVCDHDDVWWPDRLERIEARFLASDPPLGVFCDGNVIDTDGIVLQQSLWQVFGTPSVVSAEPTEFLVRYLARPSVPGCTLTISGAARALALPFPQALLGSTLDMRADGWLLALCAVAGRVEGLPETLMSYRVHTAQQIGLAELGWGGSRRRAVRILRGESVVADELARRIGATTLVRDRTRDRLGGTEAALALAALDDMLAHLELRHGLPATRRASIGRIANELCRGRYRRYSSGFASAAADLVRTRVRVKE